MAYTNDTEYPYADKTPQDSEDEGGMTLPGLLLAAILSGLMWWGILSSVHYVHQRF